MPRGRGGRGRHGGGRHHGHHRSRGWWGGGYPYYGYPYYNDLYTVPETPQVIVVDKGREESGSGINWPTIAISMMLSAFMLMRH